MSGAISAGMTFLSTVGAGIAGMSAGTAAALSVAGGLGSAAIARGGSKPKMPAIPEPIKPPQPTQTPNRVPMLASNIASGGMGNSSTFLTGAGGIDPAGLSLGRNTLLGR